jgi:ribosomal protein S18 acetylase RimI-like enzyme
VLAESAADIAVARRLIEEYGAGLGVDLSFQGFEAELAGLPGEYAPPRGALWIACIGATPMGCVAVRPLEWPQTAELKRLYVRPAARGRRLGTLLTESALSFARHAGYRRVRLDTLPSMSVALGMYQSLGFRDIEAYRFNPVQGARYLELELSVCDSG